MGDALKRRIALSWRSFNIHPAEMSIGFVVEREAGFDKVNNNCSSNERFGSRKAERPLVAQVRKHHRHVADFNTRVIESSSRLDFGNIESGRLPADVRRDGVGTETVDFFEFRQHHAIVMPLVIAPQERGPTATKSNARTPSTAK